VEEIARSKETHTMMQELANNEYQQEINTSEESTRVSNEYQQETNTSRETTPVSN
jgi:hypothetical protein